MEAFGLRLNVPEFPPKKIWRSLDIKVIKERREALSNYLQGVILNQDIAKHLIMEKSFLDFQVNFFQMSVGESAPFFTNVEIFLPGGSVATVECCIGDPTNIVKKKFCELMDINTQYTNAFGLFLGVPRVGTEVPSTFNYLCVRWLKNFESPYISQRFADEQTSNGVRHKILIRRVTWDPRVEETLLDNVGCLRILYLQAANDIQCGLMLISSDVAQKLQTLQNEKNFRQYIRLCHQQLSYGYELLAPVLLNINQTEVLSQMKVGRRQLILEYNENGKTTQKTLRSTRIRVWRMSQTHKTLENNNSENMEFQIEHLVQNEQFEVVTFNTTQAIILSLFLQSIAAEILREKTICQSPTYKFDDSVPVRAIENLEISKANSIVGDDFNIRDIANGDESRLSINGLNELFKIISHQMPFDNDSFEHVTDNDL